MGGPPPGDGVNDGGVAETAQDTPRGKRKVGHDDKRERDDDSIEGTLRLVTGQPNDGEREEVQANGHRDEAEQGDQHRDHVACPDIETDIAVWMAPRASTHADVYRRTFHAW
jgi:hypothetical protein